jgi:hypothetical protein
MSSEGRQDARVKAPVAVEGSDRPRVLVVAGYDQSAGAGVLSDVKTLEAHGVYGYAVCTGFTFQNERTISRIQWFSGEEITEQIDICYAAAPFDWVKMGITAKTWGWRRQSSIIFTGITLRCVSCGTR